MVRLALWAMAAAVFLADATGAEHRRFVWPRRMRRGHRGSHHRRHHRRASLASARVAQEIADLGVDDLLDHPEVPEVVEGVEEYKIHPLVGHQLNKMGADLQDLEAAKGTAEVDQQKLSDVQDEAAKHMSQGASLKRDIARSEAAARKEERKLKKVQGESVRIENDMKQLEQTLQNSMDPKIHAAEMRYYKRKKLAEIQAQKRDAWATKQEEYKAAAMRRLQDRRASADGLKAADEALVRAQQEQKASEEQYEEARKVASRSVEEFRYVEAKYQGAESKVKELEPEILAEEKSLNKMRNVLSLEAERIKQAEAQKEEQLKRVAEQEEKDHLAAERQVFFLKKRYADWRESEQERAAVISQRKQAYQAALDSYQDKHADVYNKASTQAAAQANRDGDWADNEDWASPGSSDPQDEEVHFQE